jgi:predicted phosphodiesterase
VWWHQAVHTLAPPPGPELFRFGTLSDLHLGESHFGYRDTIVEERPHDEPYSVRASRAAFAELTAWGSELIVVKGDITEAGQPEEWDAFGELVTATGPPMIATPGNHDGIEDLPPSRLRRMLEPSEVPRLRTGISPREGLERVGLATPGRVQVRDVPGLRVVLVDTTIPHRRTGQIAVTTDEIVTAAREAAGPVWIGLHHQLNDTHIPRYLPPGIPHAESNRFLDELVAANPAVLVTAGHTHRHRRRHHGSAVLTEVGSPKDYPGTWAGYVVHEGGIRQVVHRIAPPDLLAWTDRSADAALGLWGRWSPGSLDERCFSHTWPSDRF